MPPHPDDRSAFLPSRVPSQAEIADIIATPDNPGLRNLRITACYGELSRAIAARIGLENVNWCTFATWASRTAGQFIRLADLDVRVRAAVEEVLGPAAPGDSLRQTFRHLAGGLDRVEDRIVEATKDLARDISADVAAGNLSVFAELAPLFSAMIPALDESAAGKPDAVTPILESLQTGPTSQGGQDLLRRAVADYAEARTMLDPRRKAERVLRANAQVGAHEQIRLQPHIHSAMTASLTDRVSALLRRRAGADPLSPMEGTLASVLEPRLRPYRVALEDIWLRVATSYLMTLELPTGTLHLGRDLPSLPGEPIFPAELDALQDAELLRILRIYHADGATSHGSGAAIWSDLSDRMQFILELFRSRQRDRTLFDSPFEATAMAAIQRGSVPLLGI